MRKLTLSLLLAGTLSGGILVASAQETTPEPTEEATPTVEVTEAVEPVEPMAEETPTVHEGVTIGQYLSDGTQDSVAFWTALEASDPDLLDDLNNANSAYTIFVPTGAAFTAFEEQMGASLQALLENPELVSSVLNFHVVPGLYTSVDLAEGIATQADGIVELPTLNGQYINASLDDEDNIVINDFSLTAIDIHVANGVIHFLDSVALPENRTIDQVIGAMASIPGGEFTSLWAAIEAADPSVIELLSDPTERVTLFAPTNAAFEALGEDAVNALLADPTALTNALLNHVANGRVGSADLGDDLVAGNGTTTVTTLAGERLTITVDAAGLVWINNAFLVTSDVDAVNGTIHVIDTVLVPSGVVVPMETESADADVESESADDDSESMDVTPEAEVTPEATDAA